MKPDFSEYTLALLEGDRIIFQSDKPGLRPLLECLNECKNKRHCTLFDKVIGLAAARLIARSKIVDTIITDTASIPAVDYLNSSGIEINAKEVVENILAKDKSRICPMEENALCIKSDDEFIKIVQERFLS